LIFRIIEGRSWPIRENSGTKLMIQRLTETCW